MFLHRTIVRSNVSDRKKQLFALACAKKLKHLVLDKVRLKIELAEDYIDGTFRRKRTMKKIAAIVVCLIVGIAWAGDPPPVKKEQPKQVEVLKVMPKKVDPS